ncbi:MAG: hypothetical protein KatS3mg129_0236 [Leptospiraceae bacterium]|nr:MAG: hypothetical protein KatS3mg129_0236 [Leptospiraceae bacterium]
MARRRRAFIPRFRGKNSMILEGKIPDYINNIIDNLKDEIFTTNFLNHFYEHLNDYQQEEFDKIIQKFLEESEFLNKNKSIESNNIKENFSNKTRLRKKIKTTIRSKLYEDDFDIDEPVSYSRDAKEIEFAILNLPKNEKNKFFNNLKEFINNQAKKIKDTDHKKIKKSKENENKIFKTKLENLKKFLNLNDLEIQVLEFVYYFCSNESFSEILEEIIKTYNITLTIALLLNEDEYKIKNILQKKSKLIYYGVIDFFDMNELQLNEDIYEYLTDLSSLDFTDRFFKIIDPEIPEHKNQILDIELFHFYKDKIKIIQTLLQSEGKNNILFYGESGTGKTSLAKSIIASLNKKIIYVSNSQMDTTNNSFISHRNDSFPNRITSLIIACNYAKDNNGIVVMDEADEFLNSHFSFFSLFFSVSQTKTSIQKNWLNDFLENHNYKIIWITNHTMLMDESVKRRFDYSIHFSTFNGETREYIIKQILKKYNLENKIESENFNEYFLDPSLPIGIIDNVLKQLEQILNVNPDTSKEELIQIGKELFNSSYELVYNNRFKTPQKVIDFYDVNLIHSAPSTTQVINQIENFISNNKNKDKNLNCLFYGLSGTGKTEFAKYIAKKLNYRVIEIHPSDIKSPFFGMSERLLNNYFKKASNGNCILIINEIDAFLSKNYQHEANNSIQLQFIQEMENFKGILIGTTNSIDKIPASAKRRFHIKMEFLPIQKEKLADIFIKFFSEHLPIEKLTDQQKEKLKELDNICLGDFYAVKRQIEYEGEMYFDEIYKKLQEEVYYRLHDKN